MNASVKKTNDKTPDRESEDKPAVTTAGPKLVVGGKPAASKKAPEPVKNAPPKFDKIETLLTLEEEIRQAESVSELKYLIVNETKKLVSAQLALVHKPGRKGNLKEIEMISSLAVLDNNSPLLIWLNKEIETKLTQNDERPETQFDGAPIFIRLNTKEAPGKPFPFAYAVHVRQFAKDGRLLGAITYLKEVPFGEADASYAERISGTAAHAMHALNPRKRSYAFLFSKPVAVLATILVVAAMFIPVTLTILAPVEIIPHKPAVVASPLSGVIESIAVFPNSKVSKGQVLFKLNTVDLKNSYEIASRNAAIAEAKYRRARQGSFASGESKRELSVTKAEYQMALAEREFALAKLKQADVKASRDGIILFSGQEDWTGKPVETGERVMRIANPSHVRMRIEVESADAIILAEKATVNAFFDSDPLRPIAGTLETLSYKAETNDLNALVFPMAAVVDPGQGNHHRIGMRGTAQVYGSKVHLWFFLFRKPISSIRQMIGM